MSDNEMSAEWMTPERTQSFFESMRGAFRLDKRRQEEHAARNRANEAVTDSHDVAEAD